MNMPRYLNQQTPDGIGWTDLTWNPETGCKRRCRFGPAQTPCWAAQDAHRHGWSFEPTFRPERLGAPGKLAPREDRPWRIFVCSMADLFGPWVPTEWIEQVIAVAQDCPQHVFQFLTKSPGRYAEFEFPDNCWLGATVTGAKREHWPARAGAVCAASGGVHWLSIEPLCGGLPSLGTWLSGEYLDAPISWVVLGGMSGAGAVQPEERWVDGIERDCDEFGVPVFHKANLKCRRGDARRMEFPRVGG